jgi:hypothetical protein
VLPEPQVAVVAPVVQTQVVLLQHTPVHGEGVHVPAQTKRFGLWHVALVAPGVHAHVVELQHAPRQGLGEHAAWQKYCLSAPVQAPAVEVAQAHVEIVQQTPGHGLGLQVDPGPWAVVPAGQPVLGIPSAVQAQVVLLQHTPGQVATSHTLAPEYTVPALHGGGTCVHMPVARSQQATTTGQHVAQSHETVVPVQFACEVFVQVPVRRLQHLPRQGTGVQLVPQMNVSLELMQSATADGRHAHVLFVQQTPMHGAGEQVPPQKKVFGATQEAGVAPVVHKQVVVQHTPVQGLGEQVAWQ